MSLEGKFDDDTISEKSVKNEEEIDEDYIPSPDHKNSSKKKSNQKAVLKMMKDI